MSWLFKSGYQDSSSSSSLPASASSPVKDDLSAIGQTIGRQLRGVANFLAPPPTPSSPTSAAEVAPPQQSHSAPPSQALIGVRNDLAEIGGSLKSGLALLSSNKAVSGISRITSGFLQFRNDEEEEDVMAAGITAEVVEFVKEISGRPECWTDFPLSLDNQDFRMSDAQVEHASTVEQIVPSFAALRASLCNSMGDERFWMIYFILLLPRLHEQDFEILATPQIIETRNTLLMKLKSKKTVEVENAENCDTIDASPEGSKVSETQGGNVQSRLKGTEIVDRMGGLAIDDEEDNEQWLEDTDTDKNTSGDNRKKLENEEDVSFSDLEEDDSDISTRLSATRQAQGVRLPSPSGSSDWIQLNESSDPQGGPRKAPHSVSRDKDSDAESYDWLNVDDYD